RLVFLGQTAELVGHGRPGGAKGLRARGVGRLGGLLQRRAHFLDLAYARAHLYGQVDRQIPDVVGGKVLEHIQWLGVRVVAGIAAGRVAGCTAGLRRKCASAGSSTSAPSMFQRNMKASSRPMSAWNLMGLATQVITPMDRVMPVSMTTLPVKSRAP